MKSKRLLVVIHYPVFGGPHNRALQLAKPLDELGWRTTVLLPEESGNAVSRLRDGGVEVITMPLGRARKTKDLATHARYFLGFWPQVLAIRRLILERGFNAVLIGGLMNPHAAVAARMAGVPVVWQVVDTRTPTPLRILLMAIANRFAGSLMFTGDSLIAAHGGEPRVPAFVYFPPVDTADRFVPSAERRRSTREKLDIPHDAPVVGTVANINPQKGIEYFIRCAAEVWRAVPETWFIVVGAWYGYKQDYNTLIDKEVEVSGIPREHIMFIGGRSDVENYYPAMDVKLITSVPSSEGIPTTAIEAMACGVPVVATDVGAVREVVEDGVTGYVVPPLDVDALAKATLSLLRNDKLRSIMGESARRRACEELDISVCAEQHARALEAALSNHGA